MTARVRTVFLGSGGFGRETLHRLAGHDTVELVGVVTAPARPAGRKRQLTGTVIDDAARALGIATILRPERLRAEASIAGVLQLNPDLLVLADYGQIVPAALLDARRGALNLHPSLLPRHRGATPIPAAILAGDPETGVTLMRMDAGLDTGPIVAQERVALAGTETTPDLEARLATIAADLLDRSLAPWTRGELDATPQTTQGATLTRPLRREDGRLDPSRPAVELARQVRAYQPWPGTFVDTVVGRLTIWAATPDDAAGQKRATFDTRGIGVGDGEHLRLIEIQPAGGRRMPWEAFVRGRPAIIGSRVEPGP
ncbi:MAG: methionyl-tRNA formyltransferase [Candidatus Limnocylindrales bacterium]